MALHGLANADPSVRMVVVGDGPERKAVNRLIDKLGIGDRVEMRGWIPYDDAQDLLDRACAVLFSGVREEGGIALAEAMLRGAPVIVLANGGAKTIAEAGIDQSRVSLVSPGSRQSIAAGLGEAMTRFHLSPIADNSPNLDTEAAHETLHHAFEVALNGRESEDLQKRILAESRLVG